MIKKFNIRENIIKIISLLFSIFFAIILINTIFFNRTVHIGYKISTMIIFTIFTYSVLFLFYKIYKKLNLKFLEYEPNKIVISLTFIVIFIVQCIIAKLTYAHYGWDCEVVITNGLALVRGETFKSEYFTQYPNNIAILLITKYILLIAKMFTEIELNNAFYIMIIFNIIMVDIAALFTFLTCKKLLGNKGAYFSLIFIIPLIILSPYIIIPYTDTITMAFPITILYIYMEIKELPNKSIKKKILIFLEGFLSAMGFLIKPTVIIVTLAILIIEILYIKMSKLKKVKIIEPIAICVLFILGFSLAYSSHSYFKEKNLGQLISKEQYYDNSIPITHFLMIGMQERDNETESPGKNKTYYGNYSSEDKKLTKSIIGYREKEKYNLQIVKQRLIDFGFTGYIKFLYNKANWILCDGTFFYGCEGSWVQEDYYEKSQIGRFFQQFINKNTEQYQRITANIMQTAWILVTIGLICSFCRKNNNSINIAKFSIIGIILFILIFEGRSRYLINYIPMFILVGTYGLRNILQHNLLKLKKRRNV